MTNMDKLQQLITQNNGIVTTADLRKHNIARTYLQIFVNKGLLEKVGRGIYCEPGMWEDEMFNLQHRFSQGVFSHNTALYLHGASDRTPLEYDMTFPQGYNPSAARKENIKARTVLPKFYDIGIVSVPSSSERCVRAYDLERTLCDLLKEAKTDKEILLPALKNYVRSRERNIPKLMKYATALRIEQKMRTYMEILL